MNRHYALVAIRSHHRCEYCRAPEVVFNFPFEVEHIVPRRRGGYDDETNWALACRSCNVHKGVHTDYYDPETKTLVPIFHPRRDQWEEHFHLDPGTGVISGITPIGRATIVCLNMNTKAQLAARRQWIRLGLFP